MNGPSACAAPSASDLDRERKIERAYDELRKSTLEAAAYAGRQRQDVGSREAARQGQGRRPAPRRPARRRRCGPAGDDRPRGGRGHSVSRGARRGNGARRRSAATAARSTIDFKTFNDAVAPLERVKAMTGPPITTSRRWRRGSRARARASRKSRRPTELASAHALIAQRVGARRQRVPAPARRGLAEQCRRRATRLVCGGRGPDAVSTRAGGSAGHHGAPGAQVTLRLTRVPWTRTSLRAASPRRTRLLRLRSGRVSRTPRRPRSRARSRHGG